MRGHFFTNTTTMTLTQEQKKRYRSIGHELKPVVTISGNGLTDGVINEINRALEDHELIKVKVAVGDREVRKEAINEVTKLTRSTLVQTIGNMALLLRRSREQNKKLSNLVRFAD